MRMRGSAYYQCADCRLLNISHIEEYGSAKCIDVVVRLSRTGVTQVFWGVYDFCGTRLYEEYNEALLGHNITQGTNWGLTRAKAFVDVTEEKTP